MALGHTGKVGPDNWVPENLCGNKEDTQLSTVYLIRYLNDLTTLKKQQSKKIFKIKNFSMSLGKH